MALGECRILEFPRRDDARGSLTFLEGSRHVPFEIKRIFCLHDLALGSSRGGHAHRELHQVIVALHGTFSVTLDDGSCRETFVLDRANRGLHIVPRIWNELTDFSDKAVCLVLASDYYDEADYIRDYEQFLHEVNAR